MKLKNNIFTALLLAIGLIVHYITPGIFGGMQFDFLLMFMFVSMLLNPEFKNVLLSGILGGIFSAMATTFPGGEIANIIDKIVTSLILFGVVRLAYKVNMNSIVIGIIGGLGTLISGSIFLISALFITGLPAPLKYLIVTVVLPTTLINAIGTVFIYKMVCVSLKVSGFNMASLNTPRS